MERFVIVVNSEEAGTFYVGKGSSAFSLIKKVMHRCYARTLEEFADRYGYKTYKAAEKNWSYNHIPAADIIRVEVVA